MKQETLEEVAEHYAENEIKDRGTYKDKLICSIDFMAGAKWQKERSYSEEEVIKLLIYCKDRFGGSGLEDYTHDDEVKEWFEQFKKK
jgi:hypothetical protein